VDSDGTQVYSTPPNYYKGEDISGSTPGSSSYNLTSTATGINNNYPELRLSAPPVLPPKPDESSINSNYSTVSSQAQSTNTMRYPNSYQSASGPASNQYTQYSTTPTHHQPQTVHLPYPPAAVHKQPLIPSSKITPYTPPPPPLLQPISITPSAPYNPPAPRSSSPSGQRYFYTSPTGPAPPLPPKPGTGGAVIRGPEYFSFSQLGSVSIGIAGLRNLGNTCFMNSTLQCLSGTVPLARYFLDGSFRRSINRNNPLGTKGVLAEQFAALVKSLWSEQETVVTPTRFKDVIGHIEPRFAGNDQQDSQEFLQLLLDKLHEDMNAGRANMNNNSNNSNNSNRNDDTDDENIPEDV